MMGAGRVGVAIDEFTLIEAALRHGLWIALLIA
jgi:hypothetical protein